MCKSVPLSQKLLLHKDLLIKRKNKSVGFGTRHKCFCTKFEKKENQPIGQTLTIEIVEARRLTVNRFKKFP